MLGDLEPLIFKHTHHLSSTRLWLWIAPWREVSSISRLCRGNRHARQVFSLRICLSRRSILPFFLRYRDRRARPCTRSPNLFEPHARNAARGESKREPSPGRIARHETSDLASTFLPLSVALLSRLGNLIKLDI